MAGGGVETAASLSPGQFKFLCSFRGRILPRPSDGQLKYVGGETRVIAVPRSVTFSGLKEKMANVLKAEALIKYQLASLDLDVLVSVTCDEDLHHMLEDHDHREAKCICSHPRLRVFLFPAAASNGAAATHLHHHFASTALEQRYLDAINGVTRTPAGTPSVLTGAAAGATTNRPVFTVSSAETSPTSASETAASMFALGPGGIGACRHVNGGVGGGVRTLREIQRVHSSPNLPHNHWQQQQQQQGSRFHGLHGGGGIEYEAGVAGPAVGNTARWRPPLLHLPAHGTRHYSPSPVRTPPPCGCCCGHVEEYGYCCRRGKWD